MGGGGGGLTLLDIITKSKKKKKKKKKGLTFLEACATLKVFITLSNDTKATERHEGGALTG